MVKVKITFNKSKKIVIQKIMNNINSTLTFLKKEAEDRTL